MPVGTPLDFELDASQVATMPPEARGLNRDRVRLLVGRREQISHGVFADIGEHLGPGDVLVVNTSPTMAAAVDGTWRHTAVGLHFSTWRDDGRWTVEMRKPDRSGPILDGRIGDEIRVASGVVRLVAPEGGQPERAPRLWRADVETRGGVRRLLRRHGRPIRYGYVPQEWPIEAYQTVFADHCTWPGSAEMASAARPFSVDLVEHLKAEGVTVVPISLHAGVSSLEAHEPPRPERFDVPQSTATAVNRARGDGRRVIAVGTTATRALETVTSVDGVTRAGRGWTDLVLGPDRQTRGIDGLITGWHPPEASHLQLLEAVVGADVVSNVYEAALDGDYLWHEFGDSCLLLAR